MKSKVDLTDPKVRELISRLEERGHEAGAAVTRFNNSVRPVYVYERGGRQAEQIGSCVLLRIRDDYFVLSAAHVFDPNKNRQFLVGCGTKLHELTGERLRSAPGPSGSHRDDPLDAAVVHLAGAINTEIKSACLYLDQFDFNPQSEPRNFHVVKGYRVKRSRVVGNQAGSELDTYSSTEYSDDDYVRLGVNRSRQIAISFDDYLRVGQEWQKSPTPIGMSGGAIFRVAGVPSDLNLNLAPPSTPLLSGILIEYRPSPLDGLPAIIGQSPLGTHFKIFIGCRKIDVMKDNEF
jgi:hypothetical protein